MTTPEIWLYVVAPAACLLAVLLIGFVADKRRGPVGPRTLGITRANLVAILVVMQAVSIVLKLISGESVDWVIHFVAAAVTIGGVFLVFWIDGFVARRLGVRPFTKEPE